MNKIVFLSALFFLSSILVYGNDDHKAEDSVNIVMDLDIDPNLYQERRGSVVHRVRLYTTEVKTTIMWSDEEGYYLYTLTDNNHEVRGLDLFYTIARGNMRSYVFEQTPKKRERFSKYYRVIGLQIADTVLER